MRATPVRFLSAAAWPLTIWSSLSHFGDHPADDYVERTSPIVATAIAFWVCAAALIALAYLSGGFNVLSGEGDGGIAAMTLRSNSVLAGVLWFFAPVLYFIGFWLFTARDEAFPR